MVGGLDYRESMPEDVTISEARAQLSHLLRRVENGEQVVIRRGAQPVAMLVPMPRATNRVVWGDLVGELHDDFDEPIEDFDA